jgi:hypothetical protein
MKKLGRPDVVAVCSGDDASFVAEVIWQIPDGMATGFLPAFRDTASTSRRTSRGTSSPTMETRSPAGSG